MADELELSMDRARHRNHLVRVDFDADANDYGELPDETEEAYPVHDATFVMPFASDDTVSFAELPAQRGVRGPASLTVIFEGNRPTAAAERIGLRGIERIEVGRSRTDARAITADPGAGLVRVEIPDPWLSAHHLVLTPSTRGWVAEDRGSKNGTWVDGRRPSAEPLVDGALIHAGATALVLRAAPMSAPPPELPAVLHTLHPALARRMALLARVAGSRVPIVITGPAGTGKHRVGRAVHELSERAGRFVVVDCAALEPGGDRNALFGADGALRRADGGTLVLDDIGALAPPLQIALLRALQSGELTPIGGTNTERVDLRVIAIGDGDVRARVAAGAIREDLFARLAGFELTLPPLRDRREDIGALSAKALAALAGPRAARMRLAPDAARALFDYAWPGNARELTSAIAAALDACDGDLIEVQHLPVQILPPPSAAGRARNLGLSDTDMRAMLSDLLTRHAGNISAVARETGRARAQIHRWLKRLGIDHEQFRK